MDNSNGIRINKYLSMCGFCSRRDADRLVEEGRVLIDGKPADLWSRVSDSNEVLVDQCQVTAVQERKVFAFYKPVGYISSLSDEQGEGISGFVKNEGRIYPVGRLDKDSEGLMLLTNDGELMNSVLKAANLHEKEYLVKVEHVITENFLKKMAEGVLITNRSSGKKIRTAPAKVKKIDEKSFSIILVQGMNRQIRRMCGELGYKVVSLKRVRIMNVLLGNMKKGEYRRIEGTELEILKKSLENDNG